MAATALVASDIRNVFGSVGGAANDLFNIKGAGIKASGYREAAAMSRQNEKYQEEANKIKMMQTERQIYKTIGGQQADIAGAGFAASGTALDLLADSMQEAELARHIVETQGNLDLNNIKMQTKSYDMQAAAAETTAKGSKMSLIINSVAAVAGLALAIPTGGASLALTASGAKGINGG